MGQRYLETAKGRKIVIAVIAIVVFVVVVLFAIPSIYENYCRARTYSDLEEELNDTVISANITIVYEEYTEEDNVISNGLSYAATGVIFDHDEQYYYALTAAHVFDSDDEEEKGIISEYYYVLSYDAPLLNEARELSEEYLSLEEYCSLLPVAEIEYISENNDIAILKFCSDKELASLSIASVDSEYGDRIIAFGTSQLEIEHHYGKVTSKGTKTFKTEDGRSDHVLYSNAYVIPGYSGGVILNENMEIAGITVGGGHDFLGRFRYGAFIPVSAIADEMELWRAQ